MYEVIEGSRIDLEEGNDCSSPEQPKAVSELNACCFKEVNLQPVINLKKLNSCVKYKNFKIDGIFLLKKAFRKDNYLCKRDLQDTNFCLHQDSQEYVRFQWQERLYQFWVFLCTKKFYKTHEVPNINFEKTEYDPNFVPGWYPLYSMNPRRNNICMRSIDFSIQCLGFLVDIKKSVLQPCQKIEFLNWSLQRQYILEFLKQECVFRSQDRVALVGQQPKIEQRKVHSYLENSINNIMSCLKEVLGRLLWRMQNRGNMVRIACQGSYKRTMTESSKIWCNGVHKSFSNCQGSLLIHQQYSSTLTIWRRWWKGSHNKILSNLIKEIWNYFFRNRIRISVEYLSKVFNPEADF